MKNLVLSGQINKALGGAVAAPLAYELAEQILMIAGWLAGLVGASVPPKEVEAAFAQLLAIALTYFVIWLVPNTQPEKPKADAK